MFLSKTTCAFWERVRGEGGRKTGAGYSGSDRGWPACQQQRCFNLTF